MIDFVCFSINNWERRRARKQQFMLHLSFREDVGKVMYVEPPLNIWRLIIFPRSQLKTKENRLRWRRALSFEVEYLSENLFLLTPIFFIPFAFRIQLLYNINLFFTYHFVYRKIKSLNFNNIVLWLYHPFDYKLIFWFKDRLLSIFDWAEEWADYFSEFSSKRRKYISFLEKRLIKNVDIVLAVSKVLFECAKKINNHSYQLLDGTIPEIFANYAGRVSEDMKGIPHPIIGYTGTISRRLDIDLIAELSERLPQCSIVLVGNVLYSPIKIIKLIRKKNIFLLGEKDYAELSNYMMNFDVCILPYYSSPITSPPTKIYDYLATGKPIVSTYLSEIEGFNDYIKIAKTNEEFIEFVKGSLNENSPQLEMKRKEIARENSWLKRTDEIMNIITKRL